MDISVYSISYIYIDVNYVELNFVLQVRKLKRELDLAQEKINTLTTQLSTNVRKFNIPKTECNSSSVD